MIGNKFYSLKKIDKLKAKYNIIFGERSNGKTYACLYRILENYCKSGTQGAYLRRWREDFIGKRGSVLFDALVKNGVVEKLTHGAYNTIYYYNSRWYLSLVNDKGERLNDTNPFCFGFALSAMEHDKSTSYPDITTIVFDEFLTRSGYITDEFVLFANTLSTIIRNRDNVTIYMLGNTVNKYCPYFGEMGLKHIKDMEQGDIDTYKYANGLTVAVEYCKPFAQGKKSDVYFGFENPKLNMITGGTWEFDIYPKCPKGYDRHDILFTYFIEWDGELYQCEIIKQGQLNYTFIHKKTTPIKNDDVDLIYSTEYSPKPNYSRNIIKPRNLLERRIAEYFKFENVFYQDNETGDAIYNYLTWCANG
ncbi:MAG: phage DNA encapsidation protein [Bacteroidales bacterium]|nr:phage DNA encapsidation protein [Bacteroidales bacterium]